ncbi:retrotransposon protein, putative, ty1-copia subclass [Tanacetum coccineum]|uniref:Retrotransposon protein, putative, ty1-copia subclass n=1 Tax=Tanacetum coccineum TaxID=301880 RepID=A0ABQ5EIY0_9ASTR
MFRGNGTASNIEGKGKVILKLTSGKDLVLLNVLYVPNITKNRIYGPTLSNKGFKVVFELDKYVITKDGVYVGKGYLDEGLFKLSIVTDDNVINNKNAGTSTASVKFCYVYLINTKYEALNMFETYKAEVENQLDKKIKILRSDRGGEYESNDFAEFCSTFGIVHQTTAPYTPQQNEVAEHDELSQDQRDNTSKVPQENVKPRRSKHAKVNKDFGPDYMTYIVNEEPQTYKVAMESSEAPYWKEDIHSEIDLIVHNNTWKLVDRYSGYKRIGHKWIFKKKLRPDDTIEKYKARLVAKGYRQKEGQDFFDTYLPVTRITSIRTLIAIAAIHNLIIHQMDMKTVFLNVELDEEIYM